MLPPAPSRLGEGGVASIWLAFVQGDVAVTVSPPPLFAVVGGAGRATVCRRQYRRAVGALRLQTLFRGWRKRVWYTRHQAATLLQRSVLYVVVP